MDKEDRNEIIAYILPLMVIAVLLIIIGVVNGTFQKDVEQIGPLFRSVIPIVLVLGVPLILGLTAVFIGRVLIVVGQISTKIVTGKKNNDKETTIIECPKTEEGMIEINRRHIRNQP